MTLAANLAALMLSFQAPTVAEDPEAVPTVEGEVVEAAEAGAGIDDVASPKEDDDRIICRRTTIVGSKFKKRLCGTAKQWRSLSRRGKATTHGFQKRGKGNEPNSSTPTI